MKTIIISGDTPVVKDIAFCLQVRYDQMAVLTVVEGWQGLEILDDESPDLIFIDSFLSDITAVDLTLKIRDISDAAIIILSEGQSELVRAKQLEVGADDYVLKPFAPIELLAKVGAVLRRTRCKSVEQQHTLSLGNGISVNFNTREVFHSGKRQHLTPIECHLLSELVRNAGRVLTNGMLLEKIWGSDCSYDSGFIKKYIYRLRFKLNSDVNNHQMIINERGVGYRFIKSK